MAGAVGRALSTLEAVGSPASGVVKRKAALTKALLLVGKHAELKLRDDPHGAQDPADTLSWAAIVDAALLAIDGACKSQRGAGSRSGAALNRRPRLGAEATTTGRAPTASAAGIASQAAQLLAAAAAAGALACLVSRGRRIVRVAIKCLSRANRGSIASAIAVPLLQSTVAATPRILMAAGVDRSAELARAAVEACTALQLEEARRQ